MEADKRPSWSRVEGYSSAKKLRKQHPGSSATTIVLLHYRLLPPSAIFSHLSRTHRPRKETDMDKFLGKWEVIGTENMEEMLKSFDMEEEKRKIYNMKFVMEYKRDGDNWEYTVDMPQGVKKSFKFRVGEPYDSTTLDGRPILSCIKIENGKFVELHKDKADPQLNAEMTREIVNDELVVTATVNGISSITRHKRL